MARAFALQHDGKYQEAAAIYEAELRKFPEDAEATGMLAFCLSIQSRTTDDATEKKKLNRRARELADRAEKLGTNNPLVPLVIDGIGPDGTIREAAGRFSQKEAVDAKIREGEEAFTRNDFKKAAAAYSAAFAAEPTNPTAALLTGDAYFSSGELETACEWFRKAMALAPDAETPHRYLGDALFKLGRNEEAYHEWVAAVVRDPYSRLTRQHFSKTMREAAEGRGRAIPRFMIVKASKEGKKNSLTLPPDVDAILLSYNLAALKWRDEEFAKTYPQEKTPRRSLPEEVAAIDAMLVIAGNMKGKDEAVTKKWAPIIDGLSRLKTEGLLEAYICLERADKDLVQDYPAYRVAHEKELQRYVWLYWCGFDES